MRANETYSEVKHQFSFRSRDDFTNAQFPPEWRSTLRSDVMSSSSSMTPLVGVGGPLVLVTLVIGAWLLSLGNSSTASGTE